MQTFHHQTSTATLHVLCAALTLALHLAGCATDDLAETEQEPSMSASLSTSTSPEPTHSALIEEIEYNGTGCPRGTTSYEVDEATSTISIRFKTFDLGLDETMSVDIKNCQLRIKLRAPADRAIAVSEFAYSGYTYLEDGVGLRQVSNYFLNGTPLKTSRPEELVGPYEGVYLLKATVQPEDLAWWPCGLERDLQVNMSLRLTNSRTPRRQGHAHVIWPVGRTDGVIEFDDPSKLAHQLHLKLVSRSCP